MSVVTRLDSLWRSPTLPQPTAFSDIVPASPVSQGRVETHAYFNKAWLASIGNSYEEEVEALKVQVESEQRRNQIPARLGDAGKRTAVVYVDDRPSWSPTIVSTNALRVPPRPDSQSI